MNTQTEKIAEIQHNTVKKPRNAPFPDIKSKNTLIIK